VHTDLGSCGCIHSVILLRYFVITQTYVDIIILTGYQKVLHIGILSYSMPTFSRVTLAVSAIAELLVETNIYCFVYLQGD